VNAVLPAVVAFRVSLYESDSTVPAVFKDADNRVGGVVSPATVELFVTATSENANASLPSESWTATFDVDEFDAGAIYETETI
jgi:hypothetical protein